MKKMIAAKGLPYTDRISRHFPDPGYPDIKPTSTLTPEIIEKILKGLSDPSVGKERVRGGYSLTTIYDRGNAVVSIKHLSS